MSAQLDLLAAMHAREVGVELVLERQTTGPRPWSIRCLACGRVKGVEHVCPARPVEERFATWVQKGAGCWLWTGDTDKISGYGKFWYHGRTESAHRVAYELAIGPIPAGLYIDHLCRVRNCVNPSHMEAVTNGENILRGVGPAAVNARKVVCKRGHPLSGDHLRVDARGSRVCRTCERDQRRIRTGAKSRYADGLGFPSKRGVR